MRTPVHRVKGKPKAETATDVLADALSKSYAVARQKTFEHAGEAFTADIVLPEHKIVVELQAKQDDKGIMAEIARERIARAAGWSIFRFQESDARQDIDLVLYRLRREIQRISRA